ncbi:hypothetical protein [Methanolobus sp.]|uniref:hypothetical protein n=1 Tax=Methanolobus sp. TaxID=1874737 RepID=UPI0025E573A1|nr:hypothetical protein [Methanolobus sp.]
MKLDERIYGSQMSTLERELLFNRENTGFVRFDGNSRRTFYLDPSPFLALDKNEVFYLISGKAPGKNELVRVEVADSEIIHRGGKGRFSKTKVNFVKSWEAIDPNSISKARSLLDFEEVIDYLKMPYIGDKGVLDCIGMGSALYISSTPPCTRQVGGINAAVLGKQKNWNAYTSSMNAVIPSDFRRASSNYYYKLSEQDREFETGARREVSLSYLNPAVTPMQLPVILDIEDVKSKSKINAYCKEDYSVLNAHLLDTLLMNPSIPGDLDPYITEKTYELKNDLLDMGGLPYNQDLGSSISLMSLAYARLQHKTECSKDDVKEVFEFWVDMTHNASRELSTPVTLNELYSLRRSEKTLYTDLCNAFGTDVDVSLEEAKKATALKESQFEAALEKLNLKGYVLLMSNYQRIRILCKI